MATQSRSTMIFMRGSPSNLTHSAYQEQALDALAVDKDDIVSFFTKLGKEVATPPKPHLTRSHHL